MTRGHAARGGTGAGEYFQRAYEEGDVLWETGAPQPEVVALHRAGEIGGRVLDVGCGTGENAIHLAERGLAVAAVDIAPMAVRIARERARERGARVGLAVCDARRLPFRDGWFDTAVDSGLFHVFDDRGKAAYERSLRAALRPGGRLHVIVWSELQGGDGGPARVTRAELESRFARGWHGGRVAAGVYETAVHDGGAAAWVASFTRGEAGAPA